jgi:hypothetical protein
VLAQGKPINPHSRTKKTDEGTAELLAEMESSASEIPSQGKDGRSPPDHAGYLMGLSR